MPRALSDGEHRRGRPGTRDPVHVQHLCDRARFTTDRFIPGRAASRRRTVTRDGQGGVVVSCAEGQDVRDKSQICVWLGFASLGGYLSLGRGLAAAAHVSSQYRRPHEKATTGDLQSGAGASSHRKRSDRGAAQLPLMQRFDRTFSGSTSTAAAFARDADVHGMRSDCSLHSGSSVVGIRVVARSQALAHSVAHECASFFVWEPRRDAVSRFPIVGEGAPATWPPVSSTDSPRRGRGTVPWHASQAQ